MHKILKTERQYTIFDDVPAAITLHRKHQQHVQSSISRIDMKLKPVIAGSYLQLPNLKTDKLMLYRINAQNVHLLNKINKIQRTTGFTINRNTIPPLNRTKLNVSIERLEQIESENLKFGCKLLSVKSSLDTRRSLDLANEKLKRAEKFVIPQKTIDKYQSIVLPNDATMLNKLLRPKIFFDLEVKNIRPLGRITIQLFTEACPEVVLEFVRMCTTKSLELLNFIRIFPGLWIEGELELRENNLNYPNFDYDMTVLNHGFSTGILSFSKSYMKSFTLGLINFAISFKPLRVLNGKRCAFGVVTRGHRLIDCIQDYGTKNGKTIKDIVAVNCGTFH